MLESWPEPVTPLRDHMALIDRQAAQQPGVRRGLQAARQACQTGFWRGEHHALRALPYSPDDLAIALMRGLRGRGVVRGRVIDQVTHRPFLVYGKGNRRNNHHRQSGIRRCCRD